MRKPRTLAEAINQNIRPLESLYPAVISKGEYEAMQQAKAEHAPGVAVRINSQFQVEYYNVNTGEIVSSHF